MFSAVARSALRRVVGASSQHNARVCYHLVGFSNGNATPAAVPRSSISISRAYATATTKAQTASKARTATKGPAKATRGTKPKAKAGAKTTVAKKTNKAVAKPKKVLSESEKLAQQARRADQARRVKLRIMKQAALLNKEPDRNPYSAWQTYLAKCAREGTYMGKGMTGQERKNVFGEATSKAAAGYRDLSISEREVRNHNSTHASTANITKSLNQETIQLNIERKAAYKAFIEGYTPAQIKDVNKARTYLRKTTKYSALALLKDHRQPIRPANAFALFTKERHASGDFAGIPFTSIAGRLSQEYKALPASERQVSSATT